MYDLIGDIHGHADELEHLLRKLGYQQINGVYRHPERKVIFWAISSTVAPRYGKC